MNEKIAIWYKSDSKLVKKEELAILFARKSNLSNDYIFILQYLDKINIIQTYQDNVVRLHFKHSHYEQKNSLFLKDLSEEFISTLIDLTKYSKNDEIK